MKLLYITFALFVIPVQSWSCGSGPVTEKISQIFASLSSDQDYVNSCCESHDKHYDNWCAAAGFVNHNEADYIFEKCLENSSSMWTKYAVRPLFGFAVNLNAWYHKTISNFC